jgi:hypothetical protein
MISPSAKEFPPSRLETLNECLWRHRGHRDDERIGLRSDQSWGPRKESRLHRDIGRTTADVTSDEAPPGVHALNLVRGGVHESKPLIDRLMQIAVEHAGAERGLLILIRDGEPRIEAEATTGHGRIAVTVGHYPDTKGSAPR